MTTTAPRRRRQAPVATFQAAVLPEALRAQPPRKPKPETLARYERRMAAQQRQQDPESSAAQTVRFFNGVEVVREEPVRSPLPNGGPFRYSRLWLADDSLVWGCRDCDFIGESRGDVMAHRNAEHGSRYGKKKPKVEQDDDPDLLDLILPEREDGTQPDESMKEWTLGELMAVAPTITALGNQMDRVERENEELRKLLKENRVSRADQHKIDVYASHQAEIGELRARVAKQGNYEEVKAEMYELRAWKKKIMTRLAGVIKFTEEEQ